MVEFGKNRGKSFFCLNVFGIGIVTTVLLTQQVRRCQALSSWPPCVMREARVINSSEICVCSLRQYGSIQMRYLYEYCQPAKCIFLFYMNAKYNLALYIAFIGGKLVKVNKFLSVCEYFFTLYYLFGE